LGPLILIAIGVILLLYRVRLKDIPWEEWKCANLRIGSNARTRTTGNRADEYAVFSGVRRNVENLNFEGGEMTAVFGSIEVDLRRASISSPEKQATIEANVAFGAIELRIPESWRVALRGNAVFGAYEDKTIPPRPDAGSVVPTLVVRGGTAFGAVTVRN
ncbi:MAG TPA: LiaF domain-containing protein, partial [Bryobacteraceae bacterium]|nr:LiaF domain-containing protein [Bryobacteraceae bacterium]